MLRKTKKKQPKGVWGFLHRYWSHLWRYLVTGLLVWVPAIITLWVSWLVVSKLILGTEHLIRGLVDRVNQVGIALAPLSFLKHLHYHFGLGVLFALALFLTTGFLTRYLVGRRVIAFGEKVVRFIPLFSRVYKAVQQIRDVIVGRDGAVFQHVCLIEYPRPGMLAVAFVTSREQGTIHETVGRELVAVFVPTTPNPTSGYLVYLPPEDVTILDYSVEEAMKLIVSGGAYLPSKHRHDETEPGEESQAET